MDYFQYIQSTTKVQMLPQTSKIEQEYTSYLSNTAYERNMSNLICSVSDLLLNECMLKFAYDKYGHSRFEHVAM